MALRILKLLPLRFTTSSIVHAIRINMVLNLTGLFVFGYYYYLE